MSKEYVDKALAEQAMLDLHVKVDGDGYVWALQRDAFYAVNDLPAANVHEVIIAEWVEDSDCQPVSRDKLYCCSNCRKDHYYQWQLKTFCGDCGAVMTK